MTERIYVVFESSFRRDSSPCISHETPDQELTETTRTFCGRRVMGTGATWEPDGNNLEPDCRICYRASRKLRGLPE
jgi:hypothetical protein